MNLIVSYVTKNPCYQNNVNRVDSRYVTFQDRGPIGLMLHSVGTSQPSAEVFIKNHWDLATQTNVCVHGVIDANTGAAYQCLPWNYRGWHGGGSSNNTHVGVEMCESSHIRYLEPGETGYGPTKFTVLDREKAQADCKRCYDTAVELFASICKQYGLDPLHAICSHKEGYAQGIATNHGDPEHYWAGLGMPYSMDGFRRDVKSAMEGEINMTKEELNALIDEKIASALEQRVGTQIVHNDDIPLESVRAEMRKLLDLEVIDGGTSYAKDPDDINLSLDMIRVLVVSARYTEMLVDQLKEGLGLTGKTEDSEA